jgi:hypothetical protein
MTQPVTTAVPNDPWAAAQAPQTQPAQGHQPPAANGGQGQEQASSLAGSYAPAAAGPSLLFSQGGVAPSLFNKTHFLGAERTGIITKAPYDRQDQDYSAKVLKYWSTSKVDGKATTTDPIDGPTGQPNRPVMSTHIEMSTDYRMTAQECAAVGRDVAFAGTDDGSRVFVVTGKQGFEAFRKAIGEAIAAGVSITKDEDLIGLRLMVKRVGQKENVKGNPSWVLDVQLARPLAA